MSQPVSRSRPACRPAARLSGKRREIRHCSQSDARGATRLSTSATAPADAVKIDVTITGDQVSPNGKKIDVRRGQTVVVTVTSDAEDEVHVHTAGDGIEIPVGAGQTATRQFVATDVGSFEIESHHLNKVIAFLNVR